MAVLTTMLAALGGPAGTSLTLTYAGKTAQLTCAPPGGNHPKAVEACATLRPVGGDPGRLKPGDSLCPLLYQPVTARLTGTWQGRKVKWERTYGNTCEMRRATGVLFQF